MEMGLKFKCICCGECCKHISDEGSNSKGLPLFEWEVEKIKKLAASKNIKLNIGPIDLVYDRKSKKYFCTGYVLVDEPCVFLNDNKCAIHKDRPIVCQAFPVARNPEFLDEIPSLGCFSNCPNFDFKAFLRDSLGLEEKEAYELPKKKILKEYSKTFDKEIMKSSFARDKILSQFDEIMKTLSDEDLIDIELVEAKKNVKVIPFLQFLVEEGFMTEEDKEKFLN
ncbi:MAG: YkgJ family cysteine cluster protein [archaeon]